MYKLADISQFESVMNKRPQDYNGITLRRIRPSEAETYSWVRHDSWGDEEDPLKVTKWEKQGIADLWKNIHIGAFDKDKMIGYLMMLPCDDLYAQRYPEVEGYKKPYEIQECGVLPEYRGRGLQRALMDYAESCLPKGVDVVHAIVKDDNPTSFKNVLANKFTQVNKDQEWYSLIKELLDGKVS